MHYVCCKLGPTVNVAYYLTKCIAHAHISPCSLLENKPRPASARAWEMSSSGSADSSEEKVVKSETRLKGEPIRILHSLAQYVLFLL